MGTEAVTANSAATDVAESDSTNLATDLDSAADLNFEEPFEEEANGEVEQNGIDGDSDPVEADKGQETEDGTESADDTETEEGEQPTEVKDDVVVTVNGEKLPLSELKAGYQRQADYTRKTQELGNKRRDLEALSTRVTASVNAIADLLVKQIPPAPDPTLAMTDPGKYVADKAMHDAMMAQVASVIEQAQAPKDATNTLTQEQRAELIQSENAKLAEAFPQTAKPETRKKFFDDVSRVAGELGYSQTDLEGVTDHRMFKLAYYAKLGMDAEKAKAKATQKVANVPPMAQQKRQAPAKVRANQDAMRRLAKTGSIHDAMAIDFE